MLNHKFTFRETILLLICAVVAIGIFYYEFAYKTFKNSESSYDTAQLETDLLIAQTQESTMKKMQEYIDEHQNDQVGEIAIYNNLSQEVSALGNVLQNTAENISISWNEPTLTDTIVRRSASISFKATSYDTVKSIIQSISNLQYRCTIQDLSIDAGSDSVSTSDDIAVSLTVTFYETTEGATNTNGLTVEEESEEVFDGDSTYN